MSVDCFGYGQNIDHISVPANCTRLHLYANDISESNMPTLPKTLQDLHLCGNPKICRNTILKHFSPLPPALCNFVFCGNGLAFEVVALIQFPDTLQRLMMHGNNITPKQLLSLKLHKKCPQLRELRILSLIYEDQHPIEARVLQLCCAERERLRHLCEITACVSNSKSQTCWVSHFLVRWKMLLPNILQYC